MKRYRFPLILAALLAAVLLAPAARAEERANVPEKLKWNTADLYTSEDAWYQAKDAVAARVPKMAEFQGKLGESAATFFAAISAMEDVDKDLTRLQVYSSMRGDEDTRLAKPREMNQAVEQLAVQFYSTISYIRPEILALGAEKVNGFLAAEPRLAPYKPMLDDILRYAPHTLSAPEEKVASQAELMADNAGSAYRTFKDADMPYPEITLANGDKVRLDAQAYTKYRASADRAERDQVFEAFFSCFKSFERTFGTTLYGEVKTHLFNKDVHKFDSSLEAALFNSNVPVTVYQQLISRRARQPAHAAPLPEAAPAHDGRGSAALRGPLRPDRQEGGPALHARAGHGPGAQGGRAAGSGVRGHAQDRLREPLGGLRAHHRQALGRVQHRRLRRAPLPAAELHRAATRRSRRWPTSRATRCTPTSPTRSSRTPPTTTRSSWPRWPRR